VAPTWPACCGRTANEMLDARSRLAGSTPRPRGRSGRLVLARYGLVTAPRFSRRVAGYPALPRWILEGRAGDDTRPPGEDSRHASRNMAGPRYDGQKLGAIITVESHL